MRTLILSLVATLGFQISGLGQDPAKNGICFQPFDPDRMDAISNSAPAAVKLGKELPPLEFSRFLRFLDVETPCELKAKAPRFGDQAQTYSASISGRLYLEKGSVDLSILHKGIVVGHRSFKDAFDSIFFFPLYIWGQDEYEVRLNIKPRTKGKLSNLQINYPPLETENKPIYVSYFHNTKLPPEVRERNILRYLEAANRDKRILSELIYFAVVYVGLAVLFGFLAKGLFKRSKKSLKYKNKLKLASFASLMACGGMVCFLALELVYRCWFSWTNQEPVFMAYPFGFNQSDITRIYYERENTYRFDEKVEDKLIARLSEGVERFCLGNFYYRAHINRAGYRGELKPVSKDAKKIFCIGGSSTYGLNHEGETFPDHLQKALDLKDNGEYVVLNLGIPALNSNRFLERVKGLFTVKPEYIVIYAGFNDISLQAGDLNTFKRKAAREHLFYGAAHYSLLFRNLMVTLLTRDWETRLQEKTQITETVSCDSNLMLHHSETYAERIGEVFEHAKKVGAQVIYVDEYTAIGNLNSLNYKKELSKKIREGWKDQPSFAPKSEKGLMILSLQQQQVRKLIREKGYSHVVCLTPDCFEGKDGGLLIDWVHLTDEGNQMLGGFIADKLLLREEEIRQDQRPTDARPISMDKEWTLSQGVTLKSTDQGQEFRSSKGLFTLSKKLPLGEKAKMLYLSLYMEANHAMVLFSANLIQGGHKTALNKPGYFIPKGVQELHWACPVNGKLPHRIDLSFAGANPKTCIIIKNVQAHIR